MSATEEYVKKYGYWSIERACRENRVDVIEYFANLNTKIPAGMLTLACRLGNLDVVKCLVEQANVNINEYDYYHCYNSPIYKAITYRRIEVVKYLLEKDAEINARYVLVATEYSCLEILRMCVNFYNPHLGLLNEMLYIACQMGSLEKVDFLVSRGVDVGKLGPQLCICARHGHLDCVESLIRAGANVHTDNDAAVRMASLNKHFEVVRVLCEAGANRTLIDPKSEKYLKLIERTRNRAQKKIYFWWIPICYDPKRDSGKRMMARSWEETHALLMSQ